MRKGLLFWSGITLSILIAGLLLFLIGHVPEERNIARAIPHPTFDSPFIFVSAEGDSFNIAKGNKSANIVEDKRIIIEKLKSILPLASRSEKTAVLMTLEGTKTEVMASVRLPFKELGELAGGTIPEKWNNIGDVSLLSDKQGMMKLTPSVFNEPLFLKRDGGLLLVSTSENGLKKMISTVKEEIPSIDTDFGKLDRDYKNLFWFEDAGLLSQLCLLYGIPSRSGDVSFYAGWDQDDKRGELTWKIFGLEDILPGNYTESLRPIKWDQSAVIPEPVLLAAGINLPDIKGLLTDRTIDLEGELASSLKEVLAGPIVLNVSGRSKLLLFSLPGMGIQFLERGDAGRDLVRKFWTTKWSTFTPSLKSVEGFETGGAISVPMTLSGVANENIAYLGFLESGFLVPQRISYAFKDPGIAEKALIWFVLDGPGMSLALEKIAQAGSLAEKMGTDLGERSDELVKVADTLRDLGKISLVMKNINEGFVEWTKP